MQTMWIENGKKLIALDGKDITHQCHDLVIEGGRNFEAIRERLAEVTASSSKISGEQKRPQKGRYERRNAC